MDQNHILSEYNPSKKIIIYQLFVRLFGNKNKDLKIHGGKEENGVGKFSDINENSLSSLKEFGVTHIWYTGVIEHALLTDYSAYGIKADNPNIVKGRAGSPYAIKDYYDVNPDLADDVSNRMQEFEALVQRTHQHDMKVILDFVPNHVAREYASDSKPNNHHDLGHGDNTEVFFDPNNNFYYIPHEDLNVPKDYNPYGTDDQRSTPDYKESPAKATGNDVFHASPTINDWFETVKLNYGVDYSTGQAHFDPIPDTWLKMRNILIYWAQKGVDGFRCDFVQYTPVAFWNWVIPELKSQFPELIFIAEIYIPDQYRDYIENGHFDYLYDKVDLYDTVRELMSGHGSTDQIQNIWRNQRGYNKNMLRFLENHDEQRIASPQFAGSPLPGIPAMVLSACLYTGPVLYYFGQEVGEPAYGASGFSSDDGRTTIFDYWAVPEHQKWMNNGRFDGESLSQSQKKLRSTYSRLNQLCLHHEALSTGDLLDTHEINRYLNHENWYSNRIYSFIRYTKSETFLILVSFYDIPVQLTFSLPKDYKEELSLDQNTPLNFVDQLGSDQAFIMKEEECQIDMETWGAYVFKIL